MRQICAGVDTSTQSCTVELRDGADGTLLGTGRAPHPRTYPPVSEQDPHAWWTAFTAALAAACADADVDASAIASISVGGQCHGLVPLDTDDVPIRPAKLWNDTTGAPDVERLVAERPQSSWVEEVLIAMNPALTITKLAWLARNEPANLARLRHVLLPHDWLTFRLTGNRVTDRSDASGTGYFDARTGRYRTDLLAQHVSDAVDWAPMLPTVLGPEEVAGTVTAQAAEETGLRTDCRVGPGGGDQHLAAVGMGLRPGETAFSLGTSGVVFTPSAEPVLDRAARIDGVADTTGGYLPLLCTLNCTKVTDWFAELLGVNLTTFGELALSVDDTDLVMVPWLDGERSPMRPNASGMIAGVRTGTSRAEFAFAAFDGVVSGLVRAQQILDAHLGHPIRDRQLVIGGGARSLAYRQLLADRTGAPVVTVDANEATARGAAVQAAAVLHGETVAAMRDRWAPAVVAETGPREGRRGVRDRYSDLTVASDHYHGVSDA